ncbi:MAG: sensor histidine kinase, partial [Bacteroidota bacterium]
ILNKEGRVVIHADDNGQGIAAEAIPSLFDMFYHATDKSLGTGIGLYIVREALRRMGGTISLASEPGKGSRFTIDLPERP